MGMHHIHVFVNFQLALEDLADPETGHPSGGHIVMLTDMDSGDVYRIPLDPDSSKKLGQHLMGIGKVHLANGGDMAKTVSKLERKKR